MIPLVYRVVYVQSLVALQPYQWRLEGGGQCPGDLGLANAGFSLEEQRPLQP